jgi:hypothetical protein
MTPEQKALIKKMSDAASEKYGKLRTVQDCPGCVAATSDRLVCAMRKECGKPIKRRANGKS